MERSPTGSPPTDQRLARTASAEELFGDPAVYDRMNVERGMRSVEDYERAQAEALNRALRSGALTRTRRYSRAQVERMAERLGLDPERDFVAETVDLDRIDYREMEALLTPSQLRARQEGCPQSGRTLRYVTAYRLGPHFRFPQP